jgi:hypothetical protein
MDDKTRQQMAKMVDAVQTHCEEPVIAAMTCSHAGSMSTLLLSKMATGVGWVNRSSDLPNPVFVAVSPQTVYAFDYKPRGFKFKIKREVARWPRKDLDVLVEETDRMAYITLTTSAGAAYPLEVTTVMGGKGVVDLFVEALRSP